MSGQSIPMLKSVVAITIRNEDPVFVKVESTDFFIESVDALVNMVIRRNGSKTGNLAGSVLSSPRCSVDALVKMVIRRNESKTGNLAGSVLSSPRCFSNVEYTSLTSLQLWQNIIVLGYPFFLVANSVETHTASSSEFILSHILK